MSAKCLLRATQGRITNMISDLSHHHRPISNFLDRNSNQNLETFQLTEDQLSFYHTNGYLAGIPILSKSQVEILTTELEQLMDPVSSDNSLFYEFNLNESTEPNKVLFHALGAWRITTGFHDVLWHPAFVVAANQLLGGAVRFWHDQLFCKPAQHGGVVAWHQDYSYWTRTQPMSHLTCWIALDDTDRDNGCVHYIPGSHKWDLLPITGLAGDMEAIQQVLTEEQWTQFQSPIPIELKAGQATFHHPLMVHGSFENETDRPRRATVINVFQDGVISKQAKPMLKGTDPIPVGKKMEGRFYPLLNG